MNIKNAIEIVGKVYDLFLSIICIIICTKILIATLWFIAIHDKNKAVVTPIKNTVAIQKDIITKVDYRKI